MKEILLCTLHLLNICIFLQKISAKKEKITSNFKATIKAPIKPPIAPSKDFFGLISGASLLFMIFPPMEIPTRYAAISHVQIRINVIRTRALPFENSFFISKIYEKKYEI